MTDLDKRTDELLADALTKEGRLNAARSYRIGQRRHAPEWLLVRSLIEPPTDAKLREIEKAWANDSSLPATLQNLLRFAFAQRFATPAPEPTMEEIAARLLKAAETVFAGLNERIDGACEGDGAGVPLFAGIADLSDAINEARAMAVKVETGR